MQKLMKVIFYIFVAVIGITAVLMVVSIFPITGNFKLMVVQSGSMEPSIKTGAVVVVKPVEKYQIGDVITFKDVFKTEVPVTHRIVEIKVIEGKYHYLTKGDANDNNDPKEVSETDVVGKVLFDVPFIGYIVDGARKPLGFALLIIIPGAFIIYDESKKIWREIQQSKKDEIQNL